MTLTLPFDNSYARLPARLFAEQAPTPVAAPRLLALNTELAHELGLDVDQLRSADGIAALAGNAVPDGARPIAQAYAGHQFGNWVPQLGDGRAVLLGELDTPLGRVDLQLKGAGRTPFSRGGDGRAWLGPVLREYLVSEAMHALGIPTTRALTAIATGDAVLREAPFPGAVLTRVARSHIRVGTFQYFAARGDVEALQALTDHVIARHYPQVDGPWGLLDAVIDAQAQLVAKWMSVGFIHGVMNTDNMSVAGDTIDYGPCAFMDAYHPDRVFSSIDQFGRYAYARQPDIAAWNLAQLASSLLPLLGDEAPAIERATAMIHAFPTRFGDHWLALFRAKLGLHTPRDGDADLIGSLLDRMAAGQADFTLTFRGLADGAARSQFSDPAMFDQWAELWNRRRGDDRPDIAPDLDRVNPAIIPRNHRIEEVIQAALADDLAPFHALHAALKTPFTDHPDFREPPAPDEVVQATFCGT
ncbi:YdiU family protein [Maribius pontilimi]|uniref:Protein nucleotidyltransferase YdiU n=1 Tax=Palleronia pontilimi TaxID=1964209 RepID=A0A934MAC7_9RHOB|nr:YdiU family protein [Palleronia pontilimi]MBJ3763472.1 YdiU family protein [Palleronia pontilimi]